MNLPNTSNVFSDFVGIRRLKLRQLRVPLDFEEDLLASGSQNLQIQHRQNKRREIEVEIVSIYQSNRGTDISKGWTDLDVDRLGSPILQLRLLLGLLGVGHGTKLISRVWRV